MWLKISGIGEEKSSCAFCGYKIKNYVNNMNNMT